MLSLMEVWAKRLKRGSANNGAPWRPVVLGLVPGKGR